MVKEKQKLNEKRQKYEIIQHLSDPADTQASTSKICGGALGPDWAANRPMKGALAVST